MKLRPPRAPHRWAIAGVVLALAILAAAFLRGPSFWQKRYYPLRYEAEIAAAARRHKVNPYLIAAVINVESDFRPELTSDAGAVGLMQVLPSTAVELERRGLVTYGTAPRPATRPVGAKTVSLTDPAVNIEYGAAYLRYLVERYHEIETALAAYNAGPGHVDVWAKSGGDIREAIEFPATKHYVVEVVRARERYEALYQDAFPEWRQK